METKNIYQKLLLCQQEIGAITKTQDNPFFHSKYADINAILAVVKPILNKHGLVLTQALDMVEGHMGLITAITDVDSKEKIEGSCYWAEMPDPQKTGSAITYYRRYSIQSLLALEAQDDDGNVASSNTYQKPKPTKAEKDFMQDLEPSEEEVINWQEHIDMCRDLVELKRIWKEMPIHIQPKLEKYKNDAKFKLT